MRVALARLRAGSCAAQREEASTFAELRQRIDAMIAELRGVSTAELNHYAHAYAILGQRGVDVTRRDFLGNVAG